MGCTFLGPKLVHKNLFMLCQNSLSLRAITQRTASSFVIVSQEENNATMIVDRVHKNGYGNGGPPWQQFHPECIKRFIWVKN